MKRFNILVLTILLVLSWTARTQADEVTDWNHVVLNAIQTDKTNGLASCRVLAIVQAAVFDAVNGIQHRYTPIHVDFATAPPNASPHAAAIQAAYATLLDLYPAQQPTFDAQRAASLAALSPKWEVTPAITRGIAWGQSVADAIFYWRSTDGLAPGCPPYVGGTAPGQWRPTPPAMLPGLLPQFASMTPFVLIRPSQFRPAGPNPLGSPAYEADLAEVRDIGSLTSTTRTAFQTEVAKFWAGNTPSFWNRIAQTMAARRHNSLLQNARLFALLNLAMGDAAIACWDGKFYFVAWRPITAIALDATNPDPTWTPLITTPAFPEYPSGHATVSPSAAVVLQAICGNSGTFTLDSDVLPGVLHTFNSFAAAADEAFVARIYGGIHFRTACADGHVLGTAVGSYVLANALQPLHSL